MRSPKISSSCVEDVVLNRRPDATERLLDFAGACSRAREEKRREAEDLSWREDSRSQSAWSTPS